MSNSRYMSESQPMSGSQIRQSKTSAKGAQSPTSQALKNLRAFAIVMVLSFHSVLAYLASQPAAPEPFDSPPYHWLATPVMFFMSGVFVWPSLVRRGSWNFVYGRLVRIGLPFVFGIFLLMPIAYYPVYRVTAADPGWLAYWQHLTALPFWPGGPLWFLWELLAFDLFAIALYLTVPRSIEILGRFSASMAE